MSTTSCKRYKLNRSTTSSEDNNLAEVGFSDLQKVVEDAVKENDLEEQKSLSGFKQMYSCASVTITPTDTTFPKTITIDFGSTNCTGSDGRERKGSITAVITDYYRNPGSTITITPSNYHVNDYKVEGTKVVENIGRNADNNLSFDIDVQNGKITSPDGDVITWDSQRTREWVVGESTTWISHGLSGVLDDEYLITGSASGTDRNGRSYAATITKALRVELDCRWITEGTFELQPEDLKLRTIDFGNGDCDNQATVDINNRSYTIFMR